MELILYLAVAPAIAILWHELAHAAFALALTRGVVTLTVGLGPSVGIEVGRVNLRLAPVPLGGRCAHEGTDRRGDRALIAAAGPVSSAFLAALAWSLSQRLGPHGTAAVLAQMVAVTSACGALFTAIPIRYGPNDESDGMAVLHAVWPAAAWSRRWPQGERRPQRPLRAPFAIALAAATVGAFMASVWLGLFLVLLFGSQFAGERR